MRTTTVAMVGCVVAVSLATAACGGSKQSGANGAASFNVGGSASGAPGQPGPNGAYPNNGQPGAYPNNGYPNGGQPGAYPNNGYPNGAQPGAYPNGPQPSAGYPNGAQPGTAPGAQPGAPADIGTMVAGMLNQGMAAMGTFGGAGAMDSGLEASIKSIAAQQAPGARAAGAMQKVSPPPGGKAEVTVSFAPGKCNTVVVFGALGVQLVAARITPPAPLPPQVIAEGVSNGPSAVIGGSGQCIPSTMPIAAPMRVEVELRQGQGTVGVQLFSK